MDTHNIPILAELFFGLNLYRKYVIIYDDSGFSYYGFYVINSNGLLTNEFKDMHDNFFNREDILNGL